ncbi:Dabb family protein [Clostridium paridis]|uniref:Dabb family protein n=1 Tax=Clostridium paridis TaxID=2803863 RepID=A0A937FC91_9CLOT|nr:Dabb family protein [Clostridium paridis]MBL4930454.1 Dabb family protein [Clostridium paridis]
MIKHIVMWKLQEFAEGKSKEENAKVIKEGLESLINKIDTLKAIEVGININETAQAFDIVLYSEFDTVEGLDVYQNHPEHLKVAGFVRSVVSERVVADYEV